MSHRSSAPHVVQLVQRHWSWPAPNGKPVYNFRSDGRDFGDNRCLILADGFYEFTEPERVKGAPRKKLRDKRLFTLKNHDWFCMAGIWRTDPKVGEAFTMLTTEPGPDIAPYHDRQVVVLPREDWARWLDPATPTATVLKPLPAGNLDVARLR